MANPDPILLNRKLLAAPNPNIYKPLPPVKLNQTGEQNTEVGMAGLCRPSLRANLSSFRSPSRSLLG